MTSRILCPYNKDFYIRSVTARLNNEGYIIEIWHDMLPVDAPDRASLHTYPEEDMRKK
jgi:hypothetical protein